MKEIEARHKAYYDEDENDACLHCMQEDVYEILKKHSIHVYNSVLSDNMITLWVDTKNLHILLSAYSWEQNDNMIFIQVTDKLEITYEL